MRPLSPSAATFSLRDTRAAPDEPLDRLFVEPREPAPPLPLPLPPDLGVLGDLAVRGFLGVTLDGVLGAASAAGVRGARLTPDPADLTGVVSSGVPPVATREPPVPRFTRDPPLFTLLPLADLRRAMSIVSSSDSESYAIVLAIGSMAGESTAGEGVAGVGGGRAGGDVAAVVISVSPTREPPRLPLRPSSAAPGAGSPSGRPVQGSGRFCRTKRM